MCLTKTMEFERKGKKTHIFFCSQILSPNMLSSEQDVKEHMKYGDATKIFKGKQRTFQTYFVYLICKCDRDSTHSPVTVT